MYKLNKIRGFVALPIIIGSAVLAVGILGGLAYEYKNNQSILSVVSKNNLLAQVSSGGIQVDFPSSGFNLNVGQTYTISWSGIDYSKYSTGIQIFLRGDKVTGGSFNIADLPQSFTNQPKSYNWTVPKFSDGQYYITVACTTYCGTKTYADSSLFNIVNPIPSIKVLSPNGGETWEIGKTYPISWQISDSTAPVGVYLSGFDEFGGTYIAETILPGTNVNSISWNVLSTVKPGKYLIRAVANPNDKTKSAEDSSDAPFTISAPTPTASITISGPKGGESFVVPKGSGLSFNVNWNWTNLTAGEDMILVSFVNSAGGNEKDNISVYAGDININSGSYDMIYQLPENISSGSYFTDIIIKKRISDQIVVHVKGNNFTITNLNPSTLPTPTITVNSPNEKSNTWQIGTTQQIRWTTSRTGDIGISLVRGEFGILTSSIAYVPANSGLYSWTVPQNISPGSDYRILFGGKGEENLMSDYFTITVAPQPTCTPSTSCVAQYCQYGGNLKKCTVTNTDCSTSSYTTGSCSSAPTCTPSTSCVSQYCQYGGDLKKCTVKKTDCSTSSYTTGGCNSAPATFTTCDSTAKAIVDSVGGCTKIDKSLYSNIYNVCCVSAVVTKETLLSLLNAALADRVISDSEKTALLTALDSYLR